MKLHLLDALTTRIIKSGDCMLWTGHVMKNGYGQIKLHRVVSLVHRVAWEIENRREVPSGLDVCHTCDVRNCINPSHLFIGTRKDNMQDALRKGRTTRGAKHGCHKLCRRDVRWIRKNSTVKHSILADKLGVSRRLVSMIAQGKRWGWLQ